MNEKLLSIIIPHFNTPKQLETLLNTIQQHDDVEVIVVDDNSTLYLEEYSICEGKFKNQGVRFIKNNSGEKNAGAARNVGMNSTLGKWILFADADDYFLDDWYETVSSFFQEAECDLIYFKVSEVDTKYHQKQVEKAVCRYNLLCAAWLKGIEHADEMIRIYFYAPWSKLIKRSLIVENDIQFDSISFSNDLLFSTKVGFFANKINVCEKPIYYHVSMDGSLSTNSSEEAYYIKQVAYCRRNDFLYENMQHEKWKQIDNNEGLRRLAIAAKRHYGLKNIIKYYRMYRNHHVPVFTLNPDEITRLKRMLKE